ncbi:triosephosphate isomerase [Massilia sp. JS1662]|nr:triose-phosphate isomerase [Massilia sp. JS1662]KGF80913.1 triosephosphate isomerase [Massilia sp. JS1662]
MRRKLIVANWKMNGSRRTLIPLLTGLRANVPTSGCDVAVCVPFPYLDLCSVGLSGSVIKLGAQDLSEHADGAHTGDVSTEMLRDFGCRYVLVGHSERRVAHHEGDDVVVRKMQRAMSEGLQPIVCVGETWEERGYGHTHTVLTRQVSAVAAGLAQDQLARLIIAYEPVWAIGTGMTATPAMAQDAHATIRRCLAGYSTSAARRVPILYGGSMKPDNAGELLAMPDIDGGLVGGASLDAAQFVAIVEEAMAVVPSMA